MAMEYIDVWGVRVARGMLSSEAIEYIEELPSELPSVEWMWSEMDRIWDQLGLNNRRRNDPEIIAAFYTHPIWLINGIFVSRNPESIQHRSAISKYLADREAVQVADYGGGGGALASMIVECNPNARVKIIDPYLSELTLSQFALDTRIEIVSELDQEYDAIIAQDVLEHVDDPVGTAYLIARQLGEGGVAIFANCFYPVIKCHLPSTFHLRYTFNWIMRSLGLTYIESLAEANHVMVFEKTGSLSIENARRSEFISKTIGPLFNSMASMVFHIKRQASRQ